MIYGLDEYYDGLLLEAKSDEEIKKILEYQFVQGKGVPQEALDAIFAIDPTKKKSFTKWVLMQWENEKSAIMTALKNGRLEKMFHLFQERAGSGLQLGAMKSFSQAMEMLPDDDPIFAKEGDPNAPENDFEIVFDSPEWKIAVPHTYEADKKLGRGCRWCTAGAFGDNDSYWKRYSPKGPIWINYDKRGSEICPMDNKEYPYKRYQFLFEWDNGEGELKDCHDRDVLVEANDIDIPEDVIDFYREQDEDYVNRIMRDKEEDEEERWERYNEERWEHSHTAKVWNDFYLSLMPEEEEDLEFNENCYYYLYDEDYDTSDPIDWTTFDPDDFIADQCDGYPLAILIPNGNNSNKYYVVYYSENGHRHSWEHVENVISYGDVNGLKYFVDGAEQIWLFDTESLLMDPISTSLDDIEKVISPQINSENIEEYGSGIWLEAISKNGYHELLFVNFDEYSEDDVIEKDIPVNGEYYELSKDDRGSYIQGKYFKHYLDGEDTHISMVEELDDRYIIVSTPIGYNIWDKEEQKKILPNGLTSLTKIDDNGNVLIQRDGEWVYNYLTKKVITPKYKYFEQIRGLLVAHPDNEEAVEMCDIYDSLRGFKKILSKCDRGTFTALDEDCVLVNNNNHLVVLDRGNGSINFADSNYTRHGIFTSNYSCKDDTYIILAGKEDNEGFDFVNYKTGKVILHTAMLSRPEQLMNWEDRGVWSIKEGDKYYLVWNDTVLFKEPFDYVRREGSGIIEYEKDNRIFFCDFRRGLEPLPSKMGIDKSKVSFFGMSEGKIGIGIHEPWPLRFYYNPKENKVDGIIPMTNEHRDEAENLRVANAFLFPQASQISENFKRIYNKILNGGNLL